MCRRHLKQREVGITYRIGGQIGIGQVDPLLGTKSGTFRRRGMDPYVEFIRGDALDATYDPSVIKEYPLTILYGQEGSWEGAANPGVTRLPVAPRCGRVEVTGQHEDVSGTQEMRLPEARQFADVSVVAMTGQFGARLEVGCVTHLDVATPGYFGYDSQLAV